MVQTANGLHPQTIKDLSTWGANVIRLQLNPATYALKKGKDLWATLPEYLNLVEEKVRAAQSVNVKVILDLHEPPIYVNGKVPTLDDHNQRGFWANHPEMKDALIRMWKNIAQHFTKKEYENEIWGYDLFNEPSEKGRAAVQEWLAMVPDIITAIRTVNKNVWIVFQPGLVAETFRKEKKKIIHIQHFSKNENGLLFKEEDRKFQNGFEPLRNEIVFQKNVNSAFIGTGLEKYLKDNSIDTLFIVGISLPHCVSTTIRMASNLGFDVTLIEDATVSFEITDYFTGKKLSPEDVHRYNISALNEEFCKVINTEAFLNNY